MGRILVIRGGAIGDFILTLPAIGLLRENFPQAHIEILGYRHILALAEQRFYAQAMRSIEYAALAGFFVPNSELAPELVDYFGSFQQVISYLYDPDGFFEQNIRRCGVRHFLSGSPKLDGSAHAAEQLARPLQSLALYLEDRSAIFHPAPSDLAFAQEFLRGCLAPVVALHPGSGSPLKNWPAANWLALGNSLQASGFQIVLVGGEADSQILEFLGRNWEFTPLLARDFPLPHLAALLGRSALFVGHDSGISHLAAAAGAKCVLLFGPTNPNVWAPANPGVRVVSAPDGKLSSISLQALEKQVFDALGAGNV